MYEIKLIEGVSVSEDKPCDMVKQEWVILSMMTLGGYVQREKILIAVETSVKYALENKDCL